MIKIRVLLAVGPKLLRESLRRKIEEQDDMVAIESYTSAPPEILLDVKRNRVHVVIVEAEEDEKIPGFCSHLFAEYPETIVVALCQEEDRAFVYRQGVTINEIPAISVSSLLTTLRTAYVGYGSPS